MKRFAEGLGTHRLPAGARAGVMLMQGYALQAAIDDFNKKGGAEQVDAAAAMVSAALGIRRASTSARAFIRRSRR